MTFDNLLLDGTTHHVNIFTNTCFREYVPFKDTDCTNIEITNVHHDVNQVNKNMLSVTARIGLSPTKDIYWKKWVYKTPVSPEGPDGTDGTEYDEYSSGNEHNCGGS